MKFADNYTFETTEISVKDKNGNELINKLVELSPSFNNGYIMYDAKNDQYVLSSDLINWWKTYADNMNADLEELKFLLETYNEKEVNQILDEEFSDASYVAHHESRQKAFARIKAELRPIK